MAERIENVRLENPAPGFAPLEGGYALPERFNLVAGIKDRTSDVIQVEIEVVVAEGRARARKVSVSSDRPLGVGSLTLRAVPIREMMAGGIRGYLHRVELDKEGGASVELVETLDERAREVVQRLVGYVEVAE
jgi:hypothetical protein